jgi:hypothetical protein
MNDNVNAAARRPAFRKVTSTPSGSFLLRWRGEPTGRFRPHSLRSACFTRT